MSYTLSTTVSGSFSDTINEVTARLNEVGFGVLTEIDLTKTLHEKIGVDIKPYRILGACNPTFANEALKMEPTIGALLPCNVVVTDEGDGSCGIHIIDPVAMVKPTDNADLVPFALEVRGLLQSVLDGMQA